MQDLARLWTSVTADLGWVDLGALTIVALFFLLGLVRGLVWQLGRAGSLLGAYVLSASFAPALAAYVFVDTPVGAVHTYVAYVVVFLTGFLVLSGLARALHAAVRRSSVSAFDRLGGGLLGVGTGSAVVLGLLCVVLMFGRRLPLYGDIRTSHALHIGRATVGMLGTWAPAPVQAAFDLPPTEPAPGQPLTVATPALDEWLETRR